MALSPVAIPFNAFERVKMNNPTRKCLKMGDE